MISVRLPHPAMGLLRLSLWLLSTWYGTLAICGRRSLSKSFPYVRKFSEVVEQDKREEILMALSCSSFYLYGMLYRCLKFLTMRLYFQRVRGYICAPRLFAFRIRKPLHAAVTP